MSSAWSRTRDVTTEPTPCVCGWPARDCREGRDHVSECATYSCAACHGDPEALDLHVCGKEPFA